MKEQGQSKLNVKLTFYCIFNIVLLVPLLIYSIRYFQKSYIVNDSNISFVDTFKISRISNELSSFKSGDRRIELHSQSQEFRIWNSFIVGIKDKDMLYHDILNRKVAIFSDSEHAINYRKGKYSIIPIHQISANSDGFFDLNNVNRAEKKWYEGQLIFLSAIFIIVNLSLLKFFRQLFSLIKNLFNN